MDEVTQNRFRKIAMKLIPGCEAYFEGEGRLRFRILLDGQIISTHPPRAGWQSVDWRDEQIERFIKFIWPLRLPPLPSPAH